MKSTVLVTPCNKEIPFPKLMQSRLTKTIILFSKRNEGVVVGKPNNTPIGYYSTSFEMTNFEDFTGSVCLENGEA